MYTRWIDNIDSDLWILVTERAIRDAAEANNCDDSTSSELDDAPVTQ